MKCLVTGAAGFIGSHLCEKLLTQGHEVIGIDDLSAGHKANLYSLMPNSHFHFLERSVNDLPTPSSPIDWLFHLAARADVVPSIVDPKAYHEANVTGTVSALQFARDAGVKRFIYAASSSCYGIPDVYPTPETSECRPMHPYALTKYLGEQCVLHWAKVYKLPAVSLRLFNVYGPRSRTSGSYGAVFGVFLSQLANEKPLTIVGDGNQSRDFTFVSDVVEAFISAAESGVAGEIFNVGLGKPNSINHLCHLLGAKEIVHVPNRPGEPGMTFSDTKKIKAALGWSPRVDFEEGVWHMKKFINQYVDAPLWTPDKIKDATATWHKFLGEA